jgi:hypothetical protein
MTASIGDVYQVTDTMVLLGQTCQNRYHYEVTATTAGADAEDVLLAWIDDVYPNVLAVQPADVVHTSIRVHNLFDETDAFEELVNDAGTLGVGDVPSAFTAYGFRLVGDNAAVRSGSKRIAGTLENAATDGVVDDATILGLLDDLATQIAVTMLFGLLDAGTLAPVIVGTILDAGTYRLPANQGEAVLSSITDVLFNPVITSQVSRKIGVGE